MNYAPRVNGSLFRINRDVRFSKDKTPYKPHIDIWFWSGEAKSWDQAGFFFGLGPNRLIVGAGIHKFSKSQAAAYRDAIVGKPGSGLARRLGALKKAGYQLGGATRKRVPRGYPDDHVRSALLLHDGLTAQWEVARRRNCEARPSRIGRSPTARS